MTGAAPAGAAGSTCLPVTFGVPEHLRPWSGLEVHTSTLDIQGAGACALRGHERGDVARPHSPSDPRRAVGLSRPDPESGGVWEEGRGQPLGPGRPAADRWLSLLLQVCGPRLGVHLL